MSKTNKTAILTIITTAVFSCLFFSTVENVSAGISGVLRVHPDNPRYFTDNTGKAIYLTGSHTWSNLKCGFNCSNPAVPFDFEGNLDFMQEHNHNFMRGWTWELSKYYLYGRPTPYYSEPFPWARTGLGNALDGKPKFNLSQFDQSYFDQVRSRVIAARDRGIYVSIMFFEGWGIYYSDAPWRWNGHPFHVSNNINGINGDTNNDGKGIESHTLSISAIVEIQEAYVRKMIDTVNDLDNVLYEISNEDWSGSKDWQYHFIDFIHNYENTKPKQHPVGMTAAGPLVNSVIFASDAEWISPTGTWGNINDPYRINPPMPTNNKVVLIDTDHIWGRGGERDWVWKSFTRGNNTLFMDNLLPASNSSWSGVCNPDDARKAMGYTLTYANKMNLKNMTPSTSSSDCSTTYCLRNPGQEYLVYQPNSGSFTVNLPAGDYDYEWFNPALAVGSIVATGTVNATGGNKSFTAPFSGDAVLYLKIQQVNPFGNGPIGHWTMDSADIIGNTVKNKAGNNYNGIITSRNNPAPGGLVLGKFGQAYDFKGYAIFDQSGEVSVEGGQCIEIQNSENLNFPQFSYSFWFKVNDLYMWNINPIGKSTPCQRAPCNWRSDCGICDGKDGYGFYFDSSGTPREIDFWTKGNWGAGAYKNFPNDGKNFDWHHAVGTYDGTTSRIYLDTIAGIPSTVVKTGDSNETIHIGCGTLWNIPGDWFFNGLLDEVRLFDRVLSQTEINSLYQSNSLPAESNPADVNSDGRVNIKDIQACIKVITNSQTEQSIIDKCRVLAAPETTTNIKDIQEIIRKIITP